MNSKILFNVRPYQTRMACVEKNNRLTQVSYYQKETPSLVGNIYKGKVSQIQNSFNFAFVDIGMKKGGFLYGKDLFQKSQKVEDVLKLGEPLLVQIKSDPIRDKGPRLTTEISLPGFYMVLVPNNISKIVFSKKISEEEEKQRIEKILKEWKVPHTLIVRTLAQGKKEDELKKDLERLQLQWKELKKKFKSRKSQELIQKGDSPLINYLKNFLTEDVKTVFVDEEKNYSMVKTWLKDNGSFNVLKKIKKYSKKIPIFQEFDIESQVQKLQSKKIYLKNGGSLVIEELEAFVVIDVNTSRYKGKKNISESILAMNLEAAKVTAQQIVLRELGGIILVDFIDMETIEDRKKIVSCLERELESDKAQTKIFPMVDLGMVQITRRRKNMSLSHYLKKECLHCRGEGRVKTLPTIAGEVFAKLEKWSQSQSKLTSLFKTHRLKVTCHPHLKSWIEEKGRESIDFLKENFSVEADFEVDLDFPSEFFKIDKI
ncbi:MAG: Rne/Rng family ribonuclease [Bdellovibrionales bacterium]